MIDVIIVLIVFGVAYWYLTKDTTPAPIPMTEEQLKAGGQQLRSLD